MEWEQIDFTERKEPQLARKTKTLLTELPPLQVNLFTIKRVKHRIFQCLVYAASGRRKWHSYSQQMNVFWNGYNSWRNEGIQVHSFKGSSLQLGKQNIFETTFLPESVSFDINTILADLICNIFHAENSKLVDVKIKISRFSTNFNKPETWR